MYLTISIFLPLCFIPVVALQKKQNGWWLTASLFLLQILLFTTLILPEYLTNNHKFLPISESFSWIQVDLGDLGALKTDFMVGLDGLNVLMVLLTHVVFFIAALASRSIEKYPKTYFSLLLLMDTATLGCFLALDFLLFFIFYEFMLLPMFLLIGIWGSDRKEYAAIKFFLYTLLGSIFMILVMAGLFFSVIDPAQTAVQMQLISHSQQFNPIILDKVQNLLAEQLIPPHKMVHTFSFLSMGDSYNLIPGSILARDSVVWDISARSLAFGVLLFSFLIKLPAVPLHTWLPDAHVEAPTPVSVILAGVLLKVGGYGIMRVAIGLFPEMLKSYQLVMAVVGVASVLYGAFLAMAQTDLKRMVAYSSVSHMGYVLLGIASMQVTGWNGAIFQLFSHGIISSMLFLIVGVLYERTHSRNIEHFQGLWRLMPIFTFFVIIGFFAGLGLPTMSSFIAEMLIFMGSFATLNSAFPIPVALSILAVTGVFLSAVYFIKNFQKVWMGEPYVFQADWKNQLKDLNRLEKFLLVVLTFLIILPGLFPSLLLNWIDHSIVIMLNHLALQI